MLTACMTGDDSDQLEQMDQPEYDIAAQDQGGSAKMSICERRDYWSACGGDDDCEDCCDGRAYACFGSEQREARELHAEACKAQFCETNPWAPQPKQVTH